MNINHDPVKDQECEQFIDQVMAAITYDRLLAVTAGDLDTAWRKWISDSSTHQVQGLDTLVYSAFCAGVTDAFGEFIARHPGRRVRVSRSDFVLTKILCRSWQRPCQPIEEGEISEQDCVIISMPFSGNGSEHPDLQEILDRCDKLAVPVFIDAAYFGISHGINYPLHRPCITDFALSLSKNLAGVPLRLGIRFTRHNVDDGITAGLIGSDLFDRLGSMISIALLDKFPHDWWLHKYQARAGQICKQLGLQPTNTVTLALGPPHMTEFQRGDYIRVSISEEISRPS